jgi:hypothetical protein
VNYLNLRKNTKKIVAGTPGAHGRANAMATL